MWGHYILSYARSLNAPALGAATENKLTSISVAPEALWQPADIGNKKVAISGDILSPGVMS